MSTTVFPRFRHKVAVAGNSLSTNVIITILEGLAKRVFSQMYYLEDMNISKNNGIK